MRGGEVVSTLTGAFGLSIQETRLTAVLGYIIAINPPPFLRLFGMRGIPQRVCLEKKHENGRSDILIETSLGIGVVEAKVDATDPIEQSNRYPGRWIVLLTHRIPRREVVGRARYITWEKVAVILKAMVKSPNLRLRFLANDLLAYMKSHHMVKTERSFEIYAREINEPVTLALFLKSRLYGCKYQAGSRLSEALYFAPHFGKSITNVYPGVDIGVSYIARVESVGHATTWDDFRSLVLEQRGAAWVKQQESVFKDLRKKWTWNKDEHRSFLFLGKPRLVFNPPVQKDWLQSGKGWLSRRFYSFDELYDAWGR